jgi:hypothetical protein
MTTTPKDDKEKELCPNCKEPADGNCACMRNKCIRCGESVGNVTFTVCEDCWHRTGEAPLEHITLKPESVNGFDTFLPVRAERTGPGEYKIVNCYGHFLWNMEGNAFSDWLVKTLNRGQAKDEETREAYGWVKSALVQMFKIDGPILNQIDLCLKVSDALTALRDRAERAEANAEKLPTEKLTFRQSPTGLTYTCVKCNSGFTQLSYVHKLPNGAFLHCGCYENWGNEIAGKEDKLRVMLTEAKRQLASLTAQVATASQDSHEWQKQYCDLREWLAELVYGKGWSSGKTEDEIRHQAQRRVESNIIFGENNTSITELRQQLSLAQTELAQAKEQAVGFAKIIVGEIAKGDDGWMSGFSSADKDVIAKHTAALDYLHSIGLLEHNPYYAQYRWKEQVATKEEGKGESDENR